MTPQPSSAALTASFENTPILVSSAFSDKMAHFRETGAQLLKRLPLAQETELHNRQNERMSFIDYLGMVKENPIVTRNAFQRVYDMVMWFGVDVISDGKDGSDRKLHYRIFDDPLHNGKDAVYGMDETKDALVRALASAAQGYGTEKRVLLMHGPVGSSKSTLARLLKHGLEDYSASEEGKLFTFGWKLGEGKDEISWCPMNEEPLNLIPKNQRAKTEAFLNEGAGDDDFKVALKGKPCPHCQLQLKLAKEKFGGDYERIFEQIEVKRFVHSEDERRGIGTFQPKDEKNQDSTELTGDINYRKIAEYGSDTDARAFNFDGEFNIANRGIIEFIEVLKLDTAFLYDLLGASQEHSVKPKKFQQTQIDEVILAHTNNPEYKKLQNNEFMEALRDRTVKIDVPYLTRLSDEIKVYEKDYNKDSIKLHIAPHTIEMAAMWAVLTRLRPPSNAGLTLIQKLKLYNGKTLSGFTQENVKELREEAENEGMKGISPRYIQDKMSNALTYAAQQKLTSINPFMLMNELESGLSSHSLINSDEVRESYKELLAVVKEEYENIVKDEVQRAIAADEDALKRLCGNYIDNVKAYTQREKVRNKFTGQFEEPDGRLMRSIEEKIDIPDSRKDDFRREIMNYIAALMMDGKTFDYKSNERLLKALQKKLFEDQKDQIKLVSLVSQVVDKETQAKIDVVKSRLVRDFGYNDESATAVLQYVASIFARGDVKKK